MKSKKHKTEDGIEYFDMSEDDVLDRLAEFFETELEAENVKKMQQSDNVRRRRMAGLPVKRT